MHLTLGLHRAVQQRPNEIASICQGRRRTFTEIAQRVAKLAGALQALGMRAGDRVGMLSLNSDRYLEYYLAVFWAGGAVNPVNIRWSAAEIAYSLDDCETAILFVDDTFMPMVDELRSKSKALRTIIHAGEGETVEGMLPYEAILAAADPVPDAMREKEDLAGVFYTGGTTGFPKGVMLTHEGLFTNALSVLAESPTAEGGVGLHAAPMFHLADVTFMMLLLLRGSTHVFIPSFNPVMVLKAIEQELVSDILLVPTMIQMMVSHPAVKDHDLTSLKWIMYGASPISETTLGCAFAALPGVGFMQAYGMTEVSAVATILPPYYHTPEGRKAGKLRSAGRATFYSQVKIVNADGKEVSSGVVGQVVVRSAGVMKGYWNQPEETAGAIRNGWMHTGDGGYMDEDGFVFIVDRIKDMIVSGGENVYSAEVENALAKHPGVAMCAVIGIPDQVWGESVHAIVVLKPGVQASEEEIKAHCKTLIAGYKCPRSFEFRRELPLSGAGKLLKFKLREPFWQGKNRSVS
ncbi:long-chain-fatty-acid--CoA ligase [Pseudomonas aeruginosa]|uniref:long-chain-fatty-acid--CoA ligase n=1 Tax=Pseudomonas aeruginosa TaxID=287 RepID=UPI002043EE0B|nr:long-chain-fatty-acid--CoA ligase [Pseudomonas aeruginosa]MCM3916207.1 long-chain-fatty-acid--CoA ligase [Pseudomonas aeruginosa]MCM3928919.1 long-chain-fatty-acid--CoA ligase [Pseudomonas aeruginosa]WHV79542.1 long-chain-fatty-acid--CoA ligase [Pseudomonas aeruginosa]